MAQTMKLQFSHQDHQRQAVDAVVRVFDGQPLAQQHFNLQQTHSSVVHAPDGSIGNTLLLQPEQILSNVQDVQRDHGLPISTELHPSVSSDGAQTFTALNFSIEMETGTGKTYAYIKTMYELNRVYGFKKFVIVVPSVAIREGTIKNLEITRSHFAAEYDQVPCVAMLYDSDKLNELRHFAQSDALSVLVINIDSFTTDNTRIKQKGERAFAPIEYIQSVKPIVIVDEPQNFETDVRRSALLHLNPLCTLRYSATHRNAYNLLYALGPVQAYDMGLVKQIEVDAVQAGTDTNQAYVELLRIDVKARSLTARVRVDVDGPNGPKRSDVTLKVGDDLYHKTNQRELYLDGHVLNEIRADQGEIEFSNGTVLRLYESVGDLTDDVQRFQIERTVAAHFAKLKHLRPLGIKVLSLFFIDKVAHYRTYDDQGNPSLGRFGVWFEEAFEKYAQKPQYRGLVTHAAQEVHNGYFSGDKKGKGDKAKTRWVDTSGTVAKDSSTYQLIMQDKERLLDCAEPLQFIFSHSALREGWDNPNVFQICTLNDTHSALKKRQEIGRGLRLCVNQQGVRVMDKKINVLTVIPNESYQAFAQALQTEIEEDTGQVFAGRIKNARAKARIHRKTLSREEEELFRTIWAKINYQTRYRVRLDTDTLIQRCVALLKDPQQCPPVQAPQIYAHKASIELTQEGVYGVDTGMARIKAQGYGVAVPDVYAYIQNRVHLSRSTIFSILDGCGRMDEFLIHPQAFLDLVIRVLQKCLHSLMVEGIEYHTINDTRYEMTLFSEETETYLSSVYPPLDDAHASPLTKTLLEAQPISADQTPEGEAFTCVVTQSEVESRFAHDCSLDERVKFFMKLPSRFKIDTPLGTYNPDWAVVFEKDSRVYFVTETKSSLFQTDLRQVEQMKIQCGQKHFALNSEVSFRVATQLSDLY